ncbi:MAG: hypothetical protein KC492_46055 [Myxococcales bacterium]|nr:hypothetical protein [Myxococcales bacterium]MCB9608299.1 hypothetical protein [Polyangiaceae bacterium]
MPLDAPHITSCEETDSSLDSFPRGDANGVAMRYCLSHTSTFASKFVLPTIGLSGFTAGTVFTLAGGFMLRHDFYPKRVSSCVRALLDDERPLQCEQTQRVLRRN